MQLTIDSSESLDRILQVVGALYGVSLSAEGTPTTSTQSSSGTTTRGRGGRGGRRAGQSTGSGTGRGRSAGTGRGRQSTGRRGAGGASGGEIRQWARANGYQVSERGPIPASLRDAYAAAQRG